jgi:F-type H+-transporting ATPase subunit epsilon
VAVPLRVVSVERSLFEGEVDGQGRPFLVCLGAEGELGILPRHAPLLTTLRPGPMLIRDGSEETELFVGGGFLEVLPDRVTVLADVAERAEEISEEAAEEARRRAQERLAGQLTPGEEAEMINILQMAEARLRLARIRRGRPG